jgi:hypothetical protein
MTNTGHYNTGHYNTGYYNAGNRNTGYYNTGYRNTGNYNTGDHNTGDRNTGCFNTITPEGGYYFNRWLTHEDWDNAYKPSWLYNPTPTTWVYSRDMTSDEKSAHPDHETTGGYLRVNDMMAEWRKAYDAASLKDREAVKRLPNFDAEVFLEITGLDLRDQSETAPCEGREIEIDGVTYVLKAKE